MAIGRVAGPLLVSNLDRQGVDLQFSTNNSPLLYLDFANFRAAINANTLNTTETFTVVGNTRLANIKIQDTTVSSLSNLTLSAAGNIYLGNSAALKITGGLPDYVMTTDGFGNLSWKDLTTLVQETDLSATSIQLGTPTDGSLIVNSAYRYWTKDTVVTDAVDNLNQVVLNVYQNTYVGVADFTANVTSGPGPLTVSFSSTHLGNPNAYWWEFGDGATSTLPNPTHTYTDPLGGIYNVYFKASNSNGTLSGAGQFGDPTLAQGSYADIEKTAFITLYTPSPIPSFSLDKVVINDSDVIQLTNTSQFASSYVIYWGDGQTNIVSDNLSPGGAGGAPISHTYVTPSGDALYQVEVAAYSPTSGPTGQTITSPPTQVRVFDNHLPTFTYSSSYGNNQHNTVPNGLVVDFTNTTTTNPGITSLFPANKWQWNWGDGSSLNVNIGSAQPGDLGVPVTHAFTLVDPRVEQTFFANFQVYNGSTNSPFTSGSVGITVKPAPTSLFTGVANVVSDRVGDTPQVGYSFVDLNGNDRRLINFTNQSFNSDTYTWDLGDSTIVGPLVDGAPGTPLGITLSHQFSSTGNYTVSLLSTGINSQSPTDDTTIKANYISILSPPAPPTGLSSSTISLSSVGTSPLLAALATDNTIGLAPGAGTSVIRVTNANPIASSIVSNVYNAVSGTLSAVINGIAESPVTLTGGSDVGVFSSLTILEDKDAHSVSPSVYPSEFYKVFSGRVSKTNASVPIGYNSYQMSHSVTGSTNIVGFVKDDVILAPTLDPTLFSATTTTLGSPRYISGVPYFNTGGEIAIRDVNAYNWIGQTYLNSASPFTVTAGNVIAGSGSVVATQTKTYAQLNGSPNFITGGIPNANTGKTQGTAYTLGAIPVTINGSAASTGKIRLLLENVNGVSAQVELSALINVYSVAITGFNETAIPVDANLGGLYTDNGKRIFIAGAVGPNPTINSLTNYYTSSPFAGNINVSGTDEAIVRFGTLAHNTTNYSLYLPAGPDLSGRGDKQYFRFAFRRSTVANFTLTYTGKIAGVCISAPGTQIDNTSTLNKWIDATQVYAGAGVPGENIAAGGNGSNGCAKSAGDVIPVGQQVVNHSCILTLGSANSSDATGNQILVSIELDVGDSITSVSIS